VTAIDRTVNATPSDRLRLFAASVWQDARYAARSLRKSRSFTAVAVATLALGIGANTAIFSVLHAMLLEPLPYRDADRLAFIWLDQSRTGYARIPMSGPDYRNLRDGNHTLAAIGAIWASGTIALTGDGEPEQLRSATVSDNFFDVLGAESALGRTFRREDSAPGAPPTILLGWELFVRRFGADPSIVGRRILVNDEPTLVVGVMPTDFRLLLPTDAAVPDRLQAWQPFWPDFDQGGREALFLRVIARMRPGVTIEQTRADLDAVGQQISREVGARRGFATVPLQADGVREIRGPLVALFVGVGLLLMIACVNVAGLLVARAVSRTRETAVRLALGASRGRLLRQWLVEGMLLTTLGTVAGVLTAYLGLQVLLAFLPESLGRLHGATLNLTVLAFAFFTSLLWGVLLSLAPATELVRVREGRSLLPHWRSTTDPVRYRTRTALVVVQIAVSVVLLVGAGLLVRAFVEIQAINPGFQTGQHLTFKLALPDSRYPSTESILGAARELQWRLAALPGVTSVGAISHLPYDDLPNWALAYARDPSPAQGVLTRADTRSVSSGLFETLGVQLVEGRFFTDDEKIPVIVIDDLLARRLWPGESAVGQRLLIGQTSADRRGVIVGVVRHLRQRSLLQELSPQIFLPYRLWQRSPMAYVLRTDREPLALVPAVRAAVSAFDPRLPIYDVRPMRAYIDAALSVRRFTMVLAAVFAAAALLLTCIGVYSVLAYAVAARRQEFGVRRALGAQSVQVMAEVFREGLRCAAIGCVIGAGAAALAARLLRSQLYAVQSGDPLTFAGCLLLVLAGAALACLIPARRAIAVSPMDAIRNE
jgi:predicted permease